MGLNTGGIMRTLVLFVVVAGLSGCQASDDDLLSDNVSDDADAIELSEDLYADNLVTDTSIIGDQPILETESEALDHELGGRPSSTSLYEDEEPRRPVFDEYRAREDAKREAYRRGYRGYCSDDCSGHEAGYNWAYERRLDRPSLTFDRDSFDEGQKAFFKDVDRRVEDKRIEHDLNPEYSQYGE